MISVYHIYLKLNIDYMILKIYTIFLGYLLNLFSLIGFFKFIYTGQKVH